MEEWVHVCSLYRKERDSTKAKTFAVSPKEFLKSDKCDPIFTGSPDQLDVFVTYLRSPEKLKAPPKEQDCKRKRVQEQLQAQLKQEERQRIEDEKLQKLAVQKKGREDDETNLT